MQTTGNAVRKIEIKESTIAQELHTIEFCTNLLSKIGGDWIHQPDMHILSDPTKLTVLYCEYKFAQGPVPKKLQKPYLKALHQIFKQKWRIQLF